MIHTAYQLKAKMDAGLILAGQNEDKELEWIGTDKQWRKARALEIEYELSQF